MCVCGHVPGPQVMLPRSAACPEPVGASICYEITHMPEAARCEELPVVTMITPEDCGGSERCRNVGLRARGWVCCGCRHSNPGRALPMSRTCDGSELNGLAGAVPECSRCRHGACSACRPQPAWSLALTPQQTEPSLSSVCKKWLGMVVTKPYDVTTFLIAKVALRAEGWKYN